MGYENKKLVLVEDVGTYMLDANSFNFSVA